MREAGYQTLVSVSRLSLGVVCRHLQHFWLQLRDDLQCAGDRPARLLLPDTLDLVVLVADKTYVRKEVKVDKFGETRSRLRGRSVFKVVLFVVVLSIVAGVGYFRVPADFQDVAGARIARKSLSIPARFV